MRISRHLRSQSGIARLCDMSLRERNEELLIAGEAILLRCRFAVEGGTVGVVCGSQTSDVGDVLRKSLLPIERQVREGLVSVVLLHQSLRCGVEVLLIRGLPPVPQCALGVKGRALGVEGMADLVSDDCADGAVIS